MNFLHYQFDVGPTDLVEVTLDKQANALLLDSVNFQNYRARRGFRYYGGLAKVSPVRRRPPYPGRWHLVIDLGGRGGTVRASARIVRPQPLGAERYLAIYG